MLMLFMGCRRRTRPGCEHGSAALRESGRGHGTDIAACSLSIAARACTHADTSLSHAFACARVWRELGGWNWNGILSKVCFLGILFVVLLLGGAHLARSLFCRRCFVVAAHSPNCARLAVCVHAMMCRMSHCATVMPNPAARQQVFSTIRARCPS